MNTTSSALGRPEGSARICAVDGWRELPPTRLAIACLRCEIRAGHELDELADVTARCRTIAHEPRLSAPIPLNINAYDLALPGRLHDPLGLDADQIGFSPIATVLAKWVQAWRSWDCPPGSVRSYGSVWSLTRWFRARLSWACRIYDGLPAFVAEVRQLLFTARVEAGLMPPSERLRLPCAACGEQTLTRVWPNAYRDAESPPDVECSNPDCGWWWDAAEYAAVKAHQLVSAIPATSLLTAAEVAIARPGVRASSVRDWRRRRRLTAIPGPWGARALYELGDVDQLVTRIIDAKVARHEALTGQEMMAA